MTHDRAITLLKRKRGATIEELSNALSSEPNKIRGLLGSLRRKGFTVENIGLYRFKIMDYTNPEQEAAPINTQKPSSKITPKMNVRTVKRRGMLKQFRSKAA